MRARGGAGDGCVLQGRSGADENESFKEIDRAIERKLKEDQGVDAPKPAKALWLPESTTSSMRVMPKDFLPKREEDWKKWYHYQGSLTTEPYSENVSWFVLPVVADVRSSDVRYLATQTIEERIIEVLDRKRAMMNEVVPGTEPAHSLGLEEEDIFTLFDIRVRPRRNAAAA